MSSEKVFRMSTQKTPQQKTDEMVICSQSFNVNFRTLKMQIEI